MNSNMVPERPPYCPPCGEPAAEGFYALPQVLPGLAAVNPFLDYPGVTTIPGAQMPMPQVSPAVPIMPGTPAMPGMPGMSMPGAPGMQGMQGMPMSPSTGMQNPMGSPSTLAASPPLNPTAPITGESLQYLNGFLRSQIGRRVLVEFLVGTSTLVDRSGILIGVGTNYILLNETETDDILACDYYNIKFVRFYY